MLLPKKQEIPISIFPFLFALAQLILALIQLVFASYCFHIFLASFATIAIIRCVTQLAAMAAAAGIQ